MANKLHIKSSENICHFKSSQISDQLVCKFLSLIKQS